MVSESTFQLCLLLFSSVFSPVGQDVPVSRCRHGGEGKVYAGQVQGEGPLAVGTIRRHAVVGAIVVDDPVMLGGRVQPRRVPAGGDIRDE